MTNLPQVGQKIHVWPFPGRKVQLGHRTLDNGGRWLPQEGEDVQWSFALLEQYRSGDILLHAPPAPTAVVPAVQAIPVPILGETTTETDKE